MKAGNGRLCSDCQRLLDTFLVYLEQDLAIMVQMARAGEVIEIQDEGPLWVLTQQWLAQVTGQRVADNGTK
ncbi:hypothetical protein [Thermorudis peleae]|uniref:hypothetical protein n=1 Tax=Thermorudis peleae TaxID=1382356 RepID=UPI00056E74B2|nr:hypothetical protein [Thermorudis peleae]